MQFLRFFLLFCTCRTWPQPHVVADRHTGTGGEEQVWTSHLSSYLLQYLTTDDPKGLPGLLQLPEPMVLPENYTLKTGLTLWDQHLHGFSNLKIEAVTFNLTSLTAQIEVSLPVVTSLGRYLWEATLSYDTYGATNITLEDVQLTFRANLDLDEDGHMTMEATNAELEITYNSLSVDFEDQWTGYNLMIKTTFLLLQPTLLDVVKDWVVEAIKLELQRATQDWTFPDSISRLDYTVTKVGPYLRNSGLDPWTVGEIKVHLGYILFSKLDHVVVTGLSSLHRVNQAIVTIADSTITVFLQVGTRDVEVTWEWKPPLVPSGARVRFVALLDSFTVTLELKQEANLKSPPVLRTLDCKAGNMRVSSSGMGSLDYLVEVVANVFPNVFRNKIMDRFEHHVWQVIQAELNQVDLQALLLGQVVVHS